MDDSRFDLLTRSLTADRSRRGVARLLAGLSFGGLLAARGVSEAAAATLIGGSRCTTDSRCKTGKCLSTNKCSCSRQFPKCKQSSNPCKKATCDVETKRCVRTTRKDGASCGTDQECCGGQCVPVCSGGQLRDPITCTCCASCGGGCCLGETVCAHDIPGTFDCSASTHLCAGECFSGSAACTSEGQTNCCPGEGGRCFAREGGGFVCATEASCPLPT